MGDEYWYPLYEKMVQLDIPALIHSAGCKDPWDTYSNYFITTETRCIISMVASQTFDTFPNLKIIVATAAAPSRTRSAAIAPSSAAT